MKLLFSLSTLLLTAQVTNAFTVSSAITRNNHPATKLFSTSKSDEETAPSKEVEAKPTGHVVKNASMENVEIDPEELEVQKRFAEHQQNVQKLGFPVDVRTLVQYNHGYAVICTNSKSKDGYPSGGVVGFAPDEEGRPIFLFSGMSGHTQDILADNRCSLVVAAKEFKGAADGRVTLMGITTRIPSEEKDAAKEVYMAKHPNAFWADFGDFHFYRMEVEKVNFVGGFARAGSISAEEYTNAKPDPISQFGMHIASHMNDDHMDSTIAMIEKAIPGLDVTEATITSVDSLVMFVKVSRTPRASDQPQQFKLRLPFPKQAKDRKDVKDIIVQMTRDAASTSD